MQNITQTKTINDDIVIIDHAKARSMFLGYYAKHKAHEKAKALQVVIEHALIVSASCMFLGVFYFFYVALKAIF